MKTIDKRSSPQHYRYRTNTDMENQKVLTIYFEGTSNSLEIINTQIALFSYNTYGLNITSLSPSNQGYDPMGTKYFQIAFDGCGVTNGMTGIIFADGLIPQCESILSHIQYIISCLGSLFGEPPKPSSSSSSSLLSSLTPLSSLFSSSTSEHIPPPSPPTPTKPPLLIVNVVGLSRGGIAVIYLAQLFHERLSSHHLNQMELNLLLFDPVPGNLIWSTQFVDLFSFTTANSAMSLSQCHHIHDILALYPYLPLPDFAFHAPLLPKYPSPSHCHEIVEDACLGCHQGALFCRSKLPECRLSFTRIKNWLLSHGTIFKETDQEIIHRLYATPLECVELMEMELRREVEISIRYAHSSPSGAFIRRNPSRSARYLNKWHKELVEQGAVAEKTAADARRGGEFEYLLEIIR